MALHHIVSLYLYGGYYLANLWKIGSVIAMLHDCADVGVSISRVFSETHFSTTTAVLFLTTMVVWLWTRLLVLPIEMIYGIYLYCPEFENFYVVKYSFMYLLSCMCMLHYYWFYIFCTIMLNYKNKGEAEDTLSKSEVAFSNP